MPQEARDPVLAAAHIVTALQSVVARGVDPLDSAVLTVGAIHAGSATNIIPDSAELRGTLRSFKPETRAALRDRLRQVSESVAHGLGCGAEVALTELYPVTMNDPAMTRFVREVAEDVVGAGHVVEGKPVMGGEDFSYFLQKVPGAFVFLGSSNEAKGLCHPHHSPLFDFDEACLPIGVELLARIAMRYLER
jgi:amidohydrolase